MEVFNVVLTPENLFIKDYRTNRVVEQSLKEVPPSVLMSVQHYIQKASLFKHNSKSNYVARKITIESGSNFDRWVKRKS